MDPENKITRPDFLRAVLVGGLTLLGGCTINNYNYPADNTNNQDAPSQNTSLKAEADDPNTPKSNKPEGVVLFQMDDIQAGWLEKEAQRLVNDYHIAKGIPVTLGVIPEYLRENWSGITPPLKRWHANNRDLVEIAVHTYDHQDYAGMSLEEQVADIKKALGVFGELGIEDLRSFVPAESWGNEYTPEAIRTAGLKIGIDGLTNWEVKRVDYLKDPVILHDGVIYQNGDGLETWDFKSIEGKVDSGIARRGYFVIGYHQQDFENATPEQFDAFGSFLEDIKGAGKYQFMTASQFVRESSGE